ncbi:beclin-2-like [Echinops telfairi]|uniref:Beclin-2-like n=1 Tax=Echinops telfairi TaxID=9371 RepID=A0ABM0J7S6_ECHTE|nr:beclin-2-like [Echinops telfairi]
MSSSRFICWCCNQPLKLSWHAEASTAQQLSDGPFILAAGQSERTPEGDPTPSETDTAKLQAAATAGLSSSDWVSSVFWGQRADTFSLLGKMQSIRTLHNIQETTLGISDLLSGESELDEPLCEECTDRLLKRLDRHITTTESEIQDYKCFLEGKELPTGEDTVEALQMELSGLELEERRLVQELDAVEKTRKQVAGDLEAAQAETETLNQQEQQHHKEYSVLECQGLELLDELRSLENRLQYVHIQVDQLAKTSIFNMTFDISCKGPLGIINNFTLGCLSTTPVNWTEISAAWGQTALLLLVLAKKMGLEFQRYQLLPCGNHSYLKSLTDESELPLYCSEGKGVLENPFDLAMVAFLDCLQQFKEEAEKVGLCLPYGINVKKGRLEETGGKCYSIKTFLNTETQWTKALKCMLVNLKWGLAWVSRR